MKTKRGTPVERNFLSLSGEEREAIISLGAALRLSYLRNRLFLAESKIQQFGKQFEMTLAKLEKEGIPDDADYRTHEDYIMWHHWAEVAVEIKKDISKLEKIAQQGLFLGEAFCAGN
jgi:hypothetical protein